MAAGVTIKIKRKAGAFTGGQLAAGELGLDTTNGLVYFSADGSTVVVLPSLTAAQTLTNKDLKSSTNTIEEITTTSSSSTPTPTGGSLRNFFTVTALATNPTFAAPSGTPQNGHQLLIRIKDNGTGRTLAWNAIYRSVAATLPTSTTANKTSYVGFKYNSADSKWDCIAYGQEP